MRRASAWAMKVGKPAAGNQEGSFTEAPLASSALLEENVRVKSKAIKTVHGSEVAKVKSKVIPKTAVERDLLGTFCFAIQMLARYVTPLRSCPLLTLPTLSRCNRDRAESKLRFCRAQRQPTRLHGACI